MALKVCVEHGCPELTESARCEGCTRAQDKRRGSRQQRGYGAAHLNIRASLLPQAYGTRCPHCDEYMWPHERLDLDHTEDRKGYTGIVHASCNRSDGARRGNYYRT